VELELEIEIGRKVSKWAATLKNECPFGKEDLFSILDQMMAWYEISNGIQMHNTVDSARGKTD
jgi:hypothetical protein